MRVGGSGFVLWREGRKSWLLTVRGVWVLSLVCYHLLDGEKKRVVAIGNVGLEKLL